MVRRGPTVKSWQRLNTVLTGRSVSSCITVWQHLQATAQARFPAPVQPMVVFEPPALQNASKPKKKRPASGRNVPSAVDRMIQPQQPINFPPVNPPSDPPADPGATASVSVGPPKKKRGRPSKAEYDARVAEAAARGEEYQPPPKRKKTPRPSLQDAPNAGMVTPEVGAPGEGSPGKQKAQRPKAAPEAASSLAFEPTTRSLALKATAQAADQMHILNENHVKSTIPETQASEVEAQRSFLAGTREQAENTMPDVQSTMTLQHASTPQNAFRSYQGTMGDPTIMGEQHFL